MRKGMITKESTRLVCPNCGTLEAFVVDVSEIVTWTVNQTDEDWGIAEHSHHDPDVHFEGAFCPRCHAPLAGEAKWIARKINLI